jgi:hypothetical protein
VGGKDFFFTQLFFFDFILPLSFSFEYRQLMNRQHTKKNNIKKIIQINKNKNDSFFFFLNSTTQ